MNLRADSVKRIHLRDAKAAEESSLYLISLIEHKSNVDYNVAMQILKYMVCIWSDYAKQMEAKQEGITRNKNFRYPPILPIVYYEGSSKWTADLQLKNRILMSEVLGNYIPNFAYQVVRIHDYTNEELLMRKNEMSLIMMINKIQSMEDLAQFCQSPPEPMDEILRNSPESIRHIIRDILYGLLMKMNIPVDEAKQYTELVEEGHMGYLFENFEKVNIQQERQNTAEARKQLSDMVQSYIALCKEMHLNQAATVAKLIEECHLSQEDAEEKVNLYWTK